MKILANENVPGCTVKALREKGSSVTWIRTEMPGASDAQVIKRAQDDKSVLLTFDKGFGELAFQKGLTSPCGVILLRLAPASPEGLATSIVAVIESRSDWEGRFSVVDEGSVRVRPLPSV